MKRKEADNKYKWDFSDLYASHDEWKKDLAKFENITEVYKSFKGNLNQKEEFFRYLDFDKENDMLINKMVVYLHYGDTDQSDQEYQVLEGLLTNEWQKLSEATSFIAPEMKEVGWEVIEKWFDENKEYQIYSYGMKKFFEEAKHILSDHDEQLLSKVSRSRGAICGMYDTLAYADRQDEVIEYKGKVQTLTNSLMAEISEDTDPIKDQKLRMTAAKLFGKNFSDKKHSFAKIYEGILQSSNESIKIRNYESTLQASLSGDSVPTDVYLKLLEVGKKYIKPFEDFTLLIKEKFGMEKFYPTDRQLKLVKEYNRTFTVDEAKIIIRKALEVMGQEYLDNLDIAWADNKIDFYEDTNKRDGAYSTGGSGVDPIILMNWDDKLNSVNTLAHETGHSVHTLFADQNQPYPLSDYPIILAEVASTINEHLLFDFMYKNADSKEEKIYLLQQRIFDLVSTFYRQIQFAEFEYKASEMVANGIPLTADELGKLFGNIANEYGYNVFDKTPSIDGEENVGYGWPRVSHFFHSPFYVYKYAIDVTASYKLYADIKEGNIESTLSFLKAGGHKEPLEIMKDAGIDFTKEETYMPLIDGMDELVQELKSLIK
ncbi:oligoendopeptidase F [[Acholeplasma] multilocale]|uniref:oligoendopeptidase F n=1 Tax=[Acholeplasma] multilocale TaxID=264638 RepID=UPI00047EF96D|nr:oligoendopeptidase F [[Acholeplasma] multilocale]